MSNEIETKTEEKVEAKSSNKVVEVKAKDVAKSKKKDKVKKPNKMAKALKDTGAELKKVSWPKFKDVVKQTGVVLAVVVVFALLIFGLDRLCHLLIQLLIG